jgi:biopolymer transport protein ExbB/TolQ
MLDWTRNFLYEVASRGCEYGDCAGGPAEIFVLPAAGLLIASVALFFHGVLSARIESFRVEMKSAALQLMNDLVRPSTGGNIDTR